MIIAMEAITAALAIIQETMKTVPAELTAPADPSEPTLRAVQGMAVAASQHPDAALHRAAHANL
jgi:hypothetical protein